MAVPTTKSRQRPAPSAELQAVSELGTILTSTLELSEVLGRIMDRVHALVDASQWSMLLVDPESRRLRFELAVGEGAEAIRGKTLAMGEGVAGWVAAYGEPILVEDVRKDPRWCARFDESSGFRTRSILAVPMRVRDEVVGLIELVGGEDERPFDAEDQRLLSILADFAAIAIQNARSYARIQQMSLRDEHSGLYNARHLHQLLAREVDRSRRHDHALSLVFFDLDHFKRVNDRHGHMAGSALLAEVGTVLQEVCRRADVPCRFGGDEFVVVLVETDRAGARLAAERVRAAISARPFLADGVGPIFVTGSFGVATFPDDADDAPSLIRRADEAMYEAKARGRDGICAADEAPASPPPEKGP